MNTYRILTSYLLPVTFRGNFLRAMAKAKELSLLTGSAVKLENTATGKNVWITHVRAGVK